MAAQGISGVGLAAATGGALLAYAGFLGVNPLQALKNVASGRPPAVESRTAGLTVAKTGARAGEEDSSRGQSRGMSNALVRAAVSFEGDKYSQARRWQTGFSDCSSFVGKALKKIGVKPPGASTTTSYLLSREWKKIPRSQATTGDIAVSPSHMAIFRSADTGIGQQNPRRNVQTGPIDDLMAGTGSYTVLRYAGAGTVQ